MPSPARLVINTGPLIALAAGTGDLTLLRDLYPEVLTPREVAEEIAALQSSQFVQPAFERATWIRRWPERLQPDPWLVATLDIGEAAVIQLALKEKIDTVCIDEAAGRRVATLNGLRVTGSVGIVLRAKQESKLASVRDTLARMRTNGVWLSDRFVQLVIEKAGE